MIEKFGIDIDGVLANTPARIVEYAGQVFKVPMDVSQITKWDVPSLGILTQRQADQMFNDPEFYKHIQPLDRAQEVTHNLQAAGYDNWIVTSRKAKFWKVSMDWTEQHGVEWRSFYHSPDKAKAAKRYRIKYFVEDNLDQANALAKVCKMVFLIDWPYNQGPTAPNVVRVASLQEVLRLSVIFISQEGR